MTVHSLFFTELFFLKCKPPTLATTIDCPLKTFGMEILLTVVFTEEGSDEAAPE